MSALLEGNCADMLAAMKYAVTAAHLQLCVTHNLLVTDRPELPRSEETSWTTDHKAELAGLDATLQWLDKLSTGSDPECVLSEDLGLPPPIICSR